MTPALFTPHGAQSQAAAEDHLHSKGISVLRRRSEEEIPEQRDPHDQVHDKLQACQKHAEELSRKHSGGQSPSRQPQLQRRE